MWREFGGDQKEPIDGMIMQMRALGERLGLVRTNIQAFRDTIKTTPSVTASYRAARNHTVAVLDSLDDEYKSMSQHTAELGDGLEEIIRDTD
jgi:ABC-type transporter Mla subunit MlaD